MRRKTIKESVEKIKSIILTEEFAIDDEDGDKVVFEPGDEIDVVYSDEYDDTDVSDEEYADAIELVDVIDSDGNLVDTDQPLDSEFVDTSYTNDDSFVDTEDSYYAEDDNEEVAFDEFGNPIL